MRHVTILACALILAACSSTQSRKGASTDVQFVQLMGPEELNYPRGTIEVQFGLRITNRSVHPISLRQIQMAPVGLGGAYRLISQTYYFNEEIAANSSGDIAWWARAYAAGDPNALDANAPISVRAVAVFESPEGHFRKIMLETFRQ